MSSDLFQRPRSERARDRRRILSFLCALSLLSYFWAQVRFPLQRMIAGSSVGYPDRNDLVLDTFNAIHGSSSEFGGFYLNFSSCVRDGQAIFSVSDDLPQISGVNASRLRLFDRQFAPCGTLMSRARFASALADRDRDGAPEFAMARYDVNLSGAIARATWFVLRRRGDGWDLIALADVDHRPSAGAYIAPVWTDQPGLSAEWTFFKYRQTGGVIPIAAQELCRFKWSQESGVLRLVGTHAHVRDCMPGDTPIALSDQESIDPIIQTVIDEALSKLPRPPGSQPVSHPNTASPPPPFP